MKYLETDGGGGVWFTTSYSPVPLGNLSVSGSSNGSHGHGMSGAVVFVMTLAVIHHLFATDIARVRIRRAADRSRIPPGGCSSPVIAGLVQADRNHLQKLTPCFTGLGIHTHCAVARRGDINATTLLVLEGHLRFFPAPGSRWRCCCFRACANDSISPPSRRPSKGPRSLWSRPEFSPWLSSDSPASADKLRIETR